MDEFLENVTIMKRQLNLMKQSSFFFEVGQIQRTFHNFFLKSDKYNGHFTIFLKSNKYNGHFTFFLKSDKYNGHLTIFF